MKLFKIFYRHWMDPSSEKYCRMEQVEAKDFIGAYEHAEKIALEKKYRIVTIQEIRYHP